MNPLRVSLLALITILTTELPTCTTTVLHPRSATEISDRRLTNDGFHVLHLTETIDEENLQEEYKFDDFDLTEDDEEDSDEKPSKNWASTNLLSPAVIPYKANDERKDVHYSMSINTVPYGEPRRKRSVRRTCTGDMACDMAECCMADPLHDTPGTLVCFPRGFDGVCYRLVACRYNTDCRQGERCKLFKRLFHPRYQDIEIGHCVLR